MTKKPIFASALLAATVGSYAASANLTVIGTITPEACAVTLGGGGTVDYGALSTVTVKAYAVFGGAYKAPLKTITLNVTCSSPTALALAWTDNKAASRISVDVNDGLRFGLGVSGTTNIGAYDLGNVGMQISTTASGALVNSAGRLSRLKGSTGAWTTVTGTNLNFVDPLSEVGFKTSTADTVPPAIARITGNLLLEAYFSKALVDTATTAITLDGSATVSLVYI